LIPAPIDFKKDDRAILLYRSNYFLKRVVVTHTNGKPIFYIVDESKYLKIWELEQEDGAKCRFLYFIYVDLKLKKEYFVSSTFTGLKEFSVIGDLLITKRRIIKMQPRGIENTDLNTDFEFDVGNSQKGEEKSKVKGKGKEKEKES
jgi:hypothetical protein